MKERDFPEPAVERPDFPGRRKVTTKDLERINLGKAFWGARTDEIQSINVRDVVMRYRISIADMVRTGSGLVFAGPPGVGKTSAAACLIKEAVSAKIGAYFVTHTEMKELRFEKKDRMFGDGTDGITVKKKIETVPFLVLDGFNEPFFSDAQYGPNQLEELLIRRTSGRLTTILTTRCVSLFKQEKLADLFDLLSQCMAPLNMTGINMRDKNREALAARIHGVRP